MANIPVASRSTFMRAIARTSVPVSRSTLRFSTSTVSRNNPEQQRNLSKDDDDFSTPISGAPGWKETLATSSEAAVKADHNSGKPLELQERTVAYIRRRRHESEDPPSPHEPGVTTEAMKNGEAPTQASYTRDEVDGPLKTAHGTVVEEAELTEDVVQRKASAA
uniref:Cell surface hydrophobicity-associated protein n=1 Tax=Ganoderma boninense TaxID=34458 RepID=A0A5K1K3M6_9APHY